MSSVYRRKRIYNLPSSKNSWQVTPCCFSVTIAKEIFAFGRVDSSSTPQLRVFLQTSPRRTFCYSYTFVFVRFACRGKRKLFGAIVGVRTNSGKYEKPEDHWVFPALYRVTYFIRAVFEEKNNDANLFAHYIDVIYVYFLLLQCNKHFENVRHEESLI